MLPYEPTRRAGVVFVCLLDNMIPYVLFWVCVIFQMVNIVVGLNKCFLQKIKSGSNRTHLFYIFFRVDCKNICGAVA